MAGAGELRAVIDGTDPGWLDGVDPALLPAARNSALGRRLMARTLAGGTAATLLAPSPKPALDRVLKRWPQVKLRSLVRNLGVLAFAPVIRAEVGREPVRRLKQALDKRYLLALDRQVWDGEVPRERQAQLQSVMQDALARTDTTPALLALFNQHGCAELHAWAQLRDPALTEWLALLHPPGHPRPAAHLPPAAVQQLYAVHAGN